MYARSSGTAFTEEDLNKLLKLIAELSRIALELSKELKKMSTRSQIQFGCQNKNGFERVAQIYHHYDGYPESRLLDIKQAIELAHKHYGSEGYSYNMQTTYPSDLAGFYILAHKTGAGGVEIDEHLHGDIEYLYQVWQDNGIFNVNIYTTHMPKDEPYDSNKFRDFWDNPSVDKMRLEDTGELEDLIVRYKEV